MVNLEELGWDAQWESAFTEWSAKGWIPARVALEDKNAYAVVGVEGEMAARIAGRLRHRRMSDDALPKVGDWVALERGEGGGQAIIQEVLPRRTVVTRKLAGREVSAQILAANVDTAFLVQALDATFNPRRLERFLVMAHEGGAEAVVVLNKCDLVDREDPRIVEARRSAGSAPVLVVSARTGRGMGELRARMGRGRTVGFIGTSGVGKSSLINRLYGEEVQATLEVREADGKGRHTTTWRELILLPRGGLVIDTPGMREFHLWTAEGGLEEAFPEVVALGLRCHFRDCTHTNEARCAVKDALARGELEAHRLESFQKLRRELDTLAARQRDHAYATRRRGSRHRRRELDGTGRGRQGSEAE